jgi:hypothetical protein
MSGIPISQLKQLIIVPTLALLPPILNSLAAINLLAGIALVESSDQYLAQLGGGPAIGLWEMEPATYNDCFSNFLDFPQNATLKAIILSLMLGVKSLNPTQEMAGNLYLACAMARVKLYRAPAPLPSATDAMGMAQYHKQWYNTSLGATEIANSLPLFVQAINA